MLAKVKEKISSPSNTFVLFNHWDRVEEDGEEQASKVKQQHLSKVTKIMVHDLNIFTEEAVADRTYFVSAKQVVKDADQNAGIMHGSLEISIYTGSSRSPCSDPCVSALLTAETEAIICLHNLLSEDVCWMSILMKFYHKYS